jgi:exodeoxyribonuclease V beta subunit
MQPFDLTTAPLDGHSLIEANAGTGKTFTIEHLFLRLLVEKQLAVEKILIVTFTEAATAELRNRIRERIRLAMTELTDVGRANSSVGGVGHDQDSGWATHRRLRIALARFDEAAVCTIHGFCRRLLQDYAFESRTPFEIEFIRDQRELVAGIAQDFWRRWLYAAPDALAAHLLSLYPRPDSLVSLLTVVLSKPMLHVQSGLLDDDPNHWIAATETYHRTLSAEWRQSRDDIVDLLSQHPGLDHRSYRPKSVARWAEQLDGFFLGSDPFQLPDPLYRFGRCHIDEKSNGKAVVPDFDFFPGVDAFLTSRTAIGTALKSSFIRFGSDELERRKHQLNVRYFDDLLKQTHRALKGPDGEQLVRDVRRKYRIALIDEFQDTDSLQYEIFKRLFGTEDPQLFYIGDPKQSIYHFRGADVFAYLRAKQDARHQFTLNVNWRSDRDLIQAVNAVFSNRSNPFYCDRIGFLPSSGPEGAADRSLTIDATAPPPFVLWYLSGDVKPVSKTEARDRVARSVAAEIVRLLNLGTEGRAVIAGSGRPNGGTLVPGDIAVLVRAHHEAAQLQSVLSRQNVPAVINSKASIYQAAEFGQLLDILRAVIDYQRPDRIRTALVSPIMGYSGEQIETFNQSEDQKETAIERFRHYHWLWQRFGFLPAMRRFIRQEKVRERLIGLVDGERRLTNFLHALELCHEAARSERLGMMALLKWAERQRGNTLTQDDDQIRLETDSAAVQILTIHAAKGLQFPVVFCPFAWGSPEPDFFFFHDDQAGGRLTLDIGSDRQGQARDWAVEEARAEEIRLLYVALTRAENRLYLVWGDINKTDGAAMAYLFHPDEGADRWADLERLVASANGTLQLERLPTLDPDRFRTAASGRTAPVARRFAKALSLDWHVTSFSALSSTQATAVESPDRDVPARAPQSDGSSFSDISCQFDIHRFPGGVQTGLCFHEWFETLDFRESDPAVLQGLVDEGLERYAFDPIWREAAMETIGRVLNAPLPHPDPSAQPIYLNRIDRNDRIVELEFHFPTAPIQSSTFRRVIVDHLDTETGRNLQATLDRLQLADIGGYLKGFIDLVFRHEDRYYIVDWKTNQLGLELADYSYDRIHRYMIQNAYVLQYVLYAVALHKWLGYRLPDYDFARHFGGVFYLFVRGVDPAADAGAGIFYDHFGACGPLMNALERYFDPG